MYKRSKRLREFVTSFHLGFMFIGLFILSIGAYLINSNVSRTVSISLLVFGGLVTTTAFIGCFGATLEHTGFLNTSSSIIAITLIVQLILIGLTYVHQSQLDTYASSTWTFFKEKDPDFLLDIEQTLHCCGYASTTDRALPNSCSVKLNTSLACKDTIMTLVDQWHQWLLVLLMSLLVLEVF
ncbi:hypothetical protein K501DRAFT_282597 [Backusella circina FSU 941]|nr:hypothetical protein K501DRAFT_282597 [Backusella circina FSU 941]